MFHATGQPTIGWDLKEIDDQPTGGMVRYWEFTVKRGLLAAVTYPMDAEFLHYWDKNPQAA